VKCGSNDNYIHRAHHRYKEDATKQIEKLSETNIEIHDILQQEYILWN